MRIAVCTAVSIFFAALSFAQTGAPATFNPRDLSGIWLLQGRADRSLSTNIPAFTPAGKAKFDGNKPARGSAAGQPLKGEHPLRARAVVPALSNDPMMKCNPPGFPRLLLDPELVEFIAIQDRLLQIFQWTRTPREIWLDGRAVPAGDRLEDLGPAWYGHSVGQWDGDTLVVQTVGLDDRAWLDIYGFPKSFQARFEERYKRIDADTVELHITMTDPAFYTAPWISDRKVFKRQPREEVTYYDWYGLFSGITEAICAPMNEVDDFNKRIRDPAGLGVPATQKP
jgi:hypothetical protein